MTNTTHLQGMPKGMGEFATTPASEVKPGMKLVYNYGHTYTVLAVEPFKQSVRITEQRDEEPYTVYVRVARANRGFVAFWPKA